MELQFHKVQRSCLHKVVRQVQNQEQTQELRLPDGMPDIGRVLGAWGQVLIRGKEWRSGSMSVSGGVMAWALYMPEEGGVPQCVEAWIPFQMKWDVPDTDRDGVIRVSCLLRSVDARSISARKLILRAGIGLLGEALVPSELELYSPVQIPEDVQLLKNTYPVLMPVEAGEKSFAIEEELSLPASCPKLDKLIRYEMRPELIDQKIVSEKIVFRGAAILHIMYLAEDGEIYSWDFEIPFSQFTDLDRDYDIGALATVIPAVTSLEVENGEDGILRLKAGLTGQYIVYDRPEIEIVEDAYSPMRQVTPHMEQLQIPMILDSRTESIHAELTTDQSVSRVADISFLPDHPRMSRDSQTVQAEIPGVFQMLSYDHEGQIQSVMLRWEETWSLGAAPDSDVDIAVRPSGIPQSTAGGGNTSLRGDILIDAETAARQGLQMVTGLELGELIQADPGRPTLILRRAGEDSLWTIAKESGSTVDAINRANRLQGEPDSNQMLLIPVM